MESIILHFQRIVRLPVQRWRKAFWGGGREERGGGLWD